MEHWKHVPSFGDYKEGDTAIWVFEHGDGSKSYKPVVFLCLQSTVKANVEMYMADYKVSHEAAEEIIRNEGLCPVEVVRSGLVKSTSEHLHVDRVVKIDNPTQLFFNDLCFSKLHNSIDGLIHYDEWVS